MRKFPANWLCVAALAALAGCQTSPLYSPQPYVPLSTPQSRQLPPPRTASHGEGWQPSRGPNGEAASEMPEAAPLGNEAGPLPIEPATETNRGSASTVYRGQNVSGGTTQPDWDLKGRQRPPPNYQAVPYQPPTAAYGQPTPVDPYQTLPPQPQGPVYQQQPQAYQPPVYQQQPPQGYQQQPPVYQQQPPVYQQQQPMFQQPFASDQPPGFGSTPASGAPGAGNGGLPPLVDPRLNDERLQADQFGVIADPAIEGEVDIYAQAMEQPTGRLMLGVAVNSDLGLLGSLVLEEQNFDITRVPLGWNDIMEGRAFRGAGQQFRLELVPGDQVQRYMVSVREPFLFDTRVSAGVSGFYFTRRYQEWDEQRAGGRLTLGYQLPQRPDLTVSATLRGEQVEISNPDVPTPQDLADVVGENNIFSAKFSLAHDTRDSAFLATEGSMFEVYFEQAFGDFTYPRVGFDYRKYFLLTQRLDGSGRHTISTRAKVDWSGDDTPLFEHNFAGGYSTLRGFEFRGANPHEFGVPIGGEFMALGSVEYMAPLTADDMIRGVVFCDFGTVERKVDDFDIKNVGVAPGFGFRVQIPAIGPAPLAFDFAFPISDAADDEKQVFSFSVGFNN